MRALIAFCILFFGVAFFAVATVGCGFLITLKTVSWEESILVFLTGLGTFFIGLKLFKLLVEKIKEKLFFMALKRNLKKRR